MNKVFEIINKINEYEQKLLQLNTEMSGDISKDVVAIIQEKMKEFDIDIVAWHQYVPGFNDGEPCEFSMGGICIYKNDNIQKLKESGIENEDEYEYHCEDNPYALNFYDPRKSQYNLKSYENAKNMSDEEWSKYCSWNTKEDVISEFERHVNFIDIGEMKKPTEFSRWIDSFMTERISQFVFGLDASITIYQDSCDIEDYDCGY